MSSRGDPAYYCNETYFQLCTIPKLLVFRVNEILKHWKGRGAGWKDGKGGKGYFQLWKALRQKYGRDPTSLFPLEEGPRISADLNHEEVEAVDFLLGELGYVLKKDHRKKEQKSLFAMEQDDVGNKGSSMIRPKGSPPSESKKLQSAQKQIKDSSLTPKKWLPGFSVNGSEIASTTLSLFSEETNSINDSSTHTVGSSSNAPDKGSKQVADAGDKPPPKHLLTVW